MTATKSSANAASSPVLDWTHEVTDIPLGGRRVERAATEAERAAIAGALELSKCWRFDVSYVVEPLAGGRYRLGGMLRAEVVQPCVVTLEPVEQALEEKVDVTFCPADSLPEAGDGEREILAEPETEPIEEGRIAAGRVLFEVLAAAVDPYPRAADATFDWRDPAADQAADSGPFAALAKLKGET